MKYRVWALLDWRFHAVLLSYTPREEKGKGGMRWKKTWGEMEKDERVQKEFIIISYREYMHVYTVLLTFSLLFHSHRLD